MSMEIISAKRVNCNHRTPVNPVNPSLFINSQWKAYQRLRPLIAKADTRTENGVLSTGSTKFDSQIIKFKNQVDLQGWPREGRATTRYICNLLSVDHKWVVKILSCYTEICNKKFKDNRPEQGYSGIVSAIVEHFGGHTASMALYKTISVHCTQAH